MAWKGEEGDKRNTKYLAAGATGAALGGASINAIPAQRRIARAAYAASGQASTRAIYRGAGPREATRIGMAAGKATPGYKASQRLRGGLGVAGAAAGVGLYALHRRKKNVSKSGALMPVAAAARGGFRRKAERMALGAAAGAGRGFRYARNNAMPLVVGGSIGAGGATAYQQTSNRRSNMAKSARDEYLVSRFGKGVPSALRSWVKAGSTGRAPGGAYGAVRAGSNTIGRKGSAYASQNMTNPIGPMAVREFRGGGARAAGLGGRGKLGVESGAAARGAAARKKRGQLVAARRPGQPGRPVLP
jgi:hypothetical protein